MPRRIEVVEYDPRWRESFRAEAASLAFIFRHRWLTMHHIGSTAVPGCLSKPIVDILVETGDIASVDEVNGAMRDCGYIVLGEFGIPGRRFFVKGCDEVRTHHVHCFTGGDARVDEHLAFRDCLISRPEDAAAYGALKQSLARMHRYDIDAYMAGKEAFIRAFIDGRGIRGPGA